MGYDTYRSKKEEFTEKTTHPIWRGIGFALALLTPLMGYGVALILLEQNQIHHWMAIPKDLIAAGADPYLYVKIILTVFASLIIYLLLSLFAVFFLGIFSPPRYGPQDVPPVAYRGKRYKR